MNAMLYTEIQMEAAQCIWEAVLEDLMDYREDTPINRFRSTVGTPELRAQLRNLDILKACDDGWFMLEQNGTQDKMIPYDWEYVPFFVRNCLDWEYAENTGTISLFPNWREIITNHVEQIKED